MQPCNHECDSETREESNSTKQEQMGRSHGRLHQNQAVCSGGPVFRRLTGESHFLFFVFDRILSRPQRFLPRTAFWGHVAQTSRARSIGSSFGEIGWVSLAFEMILNDH